MMGAVEAQTTGRNNPHSLKAVYIPLWDIPQKALTTYVCALEKAETSSPLERDLGALWAVKQELQRMYTDGRRFMLMVPVHHATLFNGDSSRAYETIYRDIPEEQRKFLIFLIVNLLYSLPPDRAFWFIPALKGASRYIFAELPLRPRKEVWAEICSLCLDGVAVRIDSHIDEVATLRALKAFSAQAEAAMIKRTAIFNVSSLSMATSACCMSYAYMGGPTIHSAVAAPDSTYKFRYEDLLRAKEGLPNEL